jgi:hypothetical protein
LNVCEYGCEQEATHQFKNGKWCCSKKWQSCPGIKKKKIPWNKNKKGIYSEEFKNKLAESKEKYIKIETDELCEYGCKQQAQYKLSNGKLCCNKYYSQCHVIREKNSKSNKGKPGNRKGCEPWNKGKTKIYNKNTINKIRNGAKQTIKDIKKKYPLFSKIEEMRYNPDKPEEKEIQVHCKNHNCSNSKEKGGWFTPTSTQLYERKRSLERHGVDNSYFYCCEKCKQECPLYASKGADQLKENIQIYNGNEYHIFRKFVLNRDDYKCQYCGEQAEHVHHERPQKLEPFFALDPDLAWSVCKKCHYEKGHKDECSTGKLANKQCINMR